MLNREAMWYASMVSHCVRNDRYDSLGALVTCGPSFLCGVMLLEKLYGIPSAAPCVIFTLS